MNTISRIMSLECKPKNMRLLIKFSTYVFCGLLVFSPQPSFSEDVVENTDIVLVAELSNAAGDTLNIEDELELQRFQQLQILMEASTYDDTIREEWMNLSIEDMQKVIAIHAGELPLNGEGAAHEFYRNLQFAFLMNGEAEYVENSLEEEDYSVEELHEYWLDFARGFSKGIDGDLNYTALFAPNFTEEIIALLPNHPLTGELQKEVNIISNNAEAAANNAEAAANNAEAERLDEATEALRELNATLEELNRTLSGN